MKIKFILLLGVISVVIVIAIVAVASWMLLLGFVDEESDVTVESEQYLPIKAGYANSNVIGGNVERPDLNYDGQPDYVVKAYRENLNAHSSNHYYVLVYGDNQLYTVDYLPYRSSRKLFDRDSELSTSQGAEAVLKDYRIVLDDDAKVTYLLEAEREFGETYVDSMPVTFNVYRLTESPLNNESAEVGENRYTWLQTNSENSKGNYNDVGEAMLKELGISNNLILDIDEEPVIPGLFNGLIAMIGNRRDFVPSFLHWQ